MTNKKGFFRKYFWEGQHLEDSVEVQPDPDSSFLSNLIRTHRKYLAFLIPFAFFQIVWWTLAIIFDWFPLFQTRWEMCIVMVFGALVAGMTSEGGGAIAFPIMTLGLRIHPNIARDFSLLIQSVGMSSAAFAVIFMRVRIEKTAILFGTVGSLPGFVIGSLFADPYLEAAEKKMLFVSIWSSFAIALYILNTQKERDTFPSIPHPKPWKCVVLVFTGFVGGIFTSFAGSGVDICIFSILTLLFRITEKTATPSTIILMAINSVFGVVYRVAFKQNVDVLAFDYVIVCVPVVVLLAPLGSFLGSHFHRKVLAWMIYVLEFIAVVGFLITGPKVILVIIGAGVMVAGYVFFHYLSKAGHNLMEKIKVNKTASAVQLTTIESAQNIEEKEECKK